MEIVENSNKSSWKKVFPSFKVHSVWHGGKKSNSKRYFNKIFNQIRLITIGSKAYLEVKTQLENITFLCDIKNYKQLRQYIWYTRKDKNTNYIFTSIKIKNKKINLFFHRLIKLEWKMIDHKNRIGYDNREINLRKTTPRDNQLNCRLQINNTSGINGVSYDKFGKRWRFQYCNNKKHKIKYFKTKEEAIGFKLEYDKLTGNRNGYSILNI